LTENSPRWDEAERVALLSSVRMFAALPPAVLCQVARRFFPRHFQHGEFVFLEGRPATALNLLASGRVKVISETEEGREVILRQIGTGEIFGGAGIWGENDYPASAVAQEDAVVLQLPSLEFQSLMASHAELSLAVIQELGLRLREAEARIRDLQAEHVERRLARALVRLAAKQGHSSTVSVGLTVLLTRQDLAAVAGTTLSTASRTLSAWDQRGVITAGRQRVTIRQPAVLLALADEDGHRDDPGREGR
jgi:CRP/FNR family transcriptional regulator, nitrogen oxide reductase regulator